MRNFLFSNVLDDPMIQKLYNTKYVEFDDFFGQYDHNISSTYQKNPFFLSKLYKHLGCFLVFLADEKVFVQPKG